jgi:hypothetical protein
MPANEETEIAQSIAEADHPSAEDQQFSPQLCG